MWLSLMSSERCRIDRCTCSNVIRIALKKFCGLPATDNPSLSMRENIRQTLNWEIWYPVPDQYSYKVSKSWKTRIIREFFSLLCSKKSWWPKVMYSKWNPGTEKGIR